MQALIMAAGRGSRMKELTDATPKSMLRVAGRPLLDYKFEALPDEVNEVIIVINYLGNVIREHYGDEYQDRRIQYVQQGSPTGGSADALWKAQDLLKDRFFVVNGDNLYAKEDFVSCLRYPWAIVVQKSDAVRTGSVHVEGERVMSIAENSDHDGQEGYANTGLYLLDRRIFDYQPVPKTVGSTELGLPQTIVRAAKDIFIQAVPASWWIEIKEPSDLKKAEKFLSSRG